MSARVRKSAGRIVACIAIAVLAPTAFCAKLKKLKASANPPQYAAFSRLLSPEERLHHALDRLTFGPRPDDLDQIRRIRLDRWVDAELHPERVPENPLLAGRLAPYESLRMSIREAYLQYPPPQAILAFARGRATLPDDPELRARIVFLADRYLERKQAAAQDALDSNEDADLTQRVKLVDILTPDQIEILRSGSAGEKRRVLASLPPEKRDDFVWALPKQRRQQLFSLAPVELRRQLMAAVNPQNVVTMDLTEAKLLRAVYSNHQLEELLVDFWFNHFNVFINKGSDKYLVPTYERDAIRPHVFGKFYDLLLATAQSPAMLFYLDNWQSAAPNAIAAKSTPSRRHGLNENYGRELLELHTLGVDGGYTQRDVIEVARCFTGWTIANPRKGGGFEYNDKMHDKGQKVVLGHVIAAGGGMNDGLEVLNLLAHHPSTAHFISLRLAQRFVADDPPPSLVNRMAATFQKTGGDLREVMHTMLSSPEFWSEGAFHAKVKMPFEMVASALRATNADLTSGLALANELQKLGEPLYKKIEPTGYSTANAEWISSAALLDRMNFALALASNRIPGAEVNIESWETVAQTDPAALVRTILQADPSEQTLSGIQKALENPDFAVQAGNGQPAAPRRASLIAGLTIGSPDFQRR